MARLAKQVKAAPAVGPTMDHPLFAVALGGPCQSWGSPSYESARDLGQSGLGTDEGTDRQLLSSPDA